MQRLPAPVSAHAASKPASPWCWRALTGPGEPRRLLTAANIITVHTSKKAARETAVFSAEEQFADLTGPDNKRPVQFWNSLPGVEPVAKFANRNVAAERIWKAIQGLGHRADTRVHGATKRQVAAMFTEARLAVLPLPVEPFGLLPIRRAHGAPGRLRGGRNGLLRCAAQAGSAVGSVCSVTSGTCGY